MVYTPKRKSKPRGPRCQACDVPLTEAEAADGYRCTDRDACLGRCVGWDNWGSHLQPERITPALFRDFVVCEGPEQFAWCIALFFRNGSLDLKE